jgi:hypothetical protein
VIRAITAVLIGSVALWLAAPAIAGNGSRQDAELTFTKRKPAKPTGLRLRIDYTNPEDPQAKPPAVRRVVETLRRGARIDTGAPALCTASDLELMLLGPGACPGDSVVGTGRLTLDTGLPQPARYLTVDVTFLNNTDQLIFLTAVQPLEARVVIRATQSERTATSEAPFLPGTLPDGAAIDVVRADFPRLVSDRGSYITTPPRCPRRRHWTNRIGFTYADGVTQTVRSASPCKRRKRRR